jgi:hypothetical protein
MTSICMLWGVYCISILHSASKQLPVVAAGTVLGKALVNAGFLCLMPCSARAAGQRVRENCEVLPGKPLTSKRIGDR